MVDGRITRSKSVSPEVLRTEVKEERVRSTRGLSPLFKSLANPLKEEIDELDPLQAGVESAFGRVGGGFKRQSTWVAEPIIGGSNAVTVDRHITINPDTNYSAPGQKHYDLYASLENLEKLKNGEAKHLFVQGKNSEGRKLPGDWRYGGTYIPKKMKVITTRMLREVYSVEQQQEVLNNLATGLKSWNGYIDWGIKFEEVGRTRRELKKILFSKVGVEFQITYTPLEFQKYSEEFNQWQNNVRVWEAEYPIPIKKPSKTKKLSTEGKSRKKRASK